MKMIRIVGWMDGFRWSVDVKTKEKKISDIQNVDKNELDGNSAVSAYGICLYFIHIHTMDNKIPFSMMICGGRSLSYQR